MSGKHYKGHEVSCCIKYFIFGFNIIFWLLGVAFLGIGLWAWSEKGVLSNISSITDLGGFDPVWLFLVVGGVMFILGFAGCIGALRENTFLLKFFSVFLGIIFFLELTAGVLAFVFKDWIKDQLNFFINNNIRAYRDDIDLQNLIDFTQEYWECCGAFGADDWNLNIYFNCTDANPSREKCGVPFSCCTKDPAEDVINTQCGYDVRAKADVEQKTYIYVKGCVPQFEKDCAATDFRDMLGAKPSERHRSCEGELSVHLRPPPALTFKDTGLLKHAGTSEGGGGARSRDGQVPPCPKLYKDYLHFTERSASASTPAWGSPRCSPFGTLTPEHRRGGRNLETRASEAQAQERLYVRGPAGGAREGLN
ncbi:hypothetical protein AAFF_G00191200 [Aldrovandia affinis]|uniref:Tetraspanin n=1 Tax=Aldrovandia affinis TaxID=143900 RepID=A0AAD7W6K0_9TELE|nr:hypothetical protein AAFF_G00191200 [Aldrovandia affinis]